MLNPRSSINTIDDGSQEVAKLAQQRGSIQSVEVTSPPSLAALTQDTQTVMADEKQVATMKYVAMIGGSRSSRVSQHGRERLDDDNGETSSPIDELYGDSVDESSKSTVMAIAEGGLGED